MLLLSIDSSTTLASLALYKDQKLIGLKKSDSQKSHAEYMNQALAELLLSSSHNLNQLDIIALTHGPGSFTGIRVAISLAKTISYSLKKDLWVTDSLNVLASQISWKNLTVCGINAFKNMMYAKLFIDGNPISESFVIKYADLDLFLKNKSHNDSIYFIGDCFDYVKSALSPELKIQVQFKTDLLKNPQADLLAQVFYNNKNWGSTYDWNSLSPLYLRGSEAEENIKQFSSEKK